MTAFKRRPIAPFDADLLSNDLDSSSKILEEFRGKTRRLKKIFHVSPDGSSSLENDQSYGLRLLTPGKTPSEGETAPNAPDVVPNESPKPRRTENLHMRVLSPIDVVPCTQEEPDELPATQKSSQSFRRTLFELTDSQPFATALTSSTPLISRRREKEGFFDEANDKILSPIEQSPKAINSNARITTLGELENDLQNQYEIVEKPIAAAARTPVRKRSQTPSQYRGSPRSSVSSVSRMDVEEFKDRFKLKNLSIVINQTDLNPVEIVETPIVQKRQGLTACNSALAEKLRLCETTDDESPAKRKPVKSSQGSTNKSTKGSQKTTEALTSESSDNESTRSDERPTKATVNQPVKLSQASSKKSMQRAQKTTEPLTSESSSENESTDSEEQSTKDVRVQPVNLSKVSTKKPTKASQKPKLRAATLKGKNANVAKSSSALAKNQDTTSESSSESEEEQDNVEQRNESLIQPSSSQKSSSNSQEAVNESQTADEPEKEESLASSTLKPSQASKSLKGVRAAKTKEQPLIAKKSVSDQHVGEQTQSKAKTQVSKGKRKVNEPASEPDVGLSKPADPPQPETNDKNLFAVPKPRMPARAKKGKAQKAPEVSQMQSRSQENVELSVSSPSVLKTVSESAMDSISALRTHRTVYETQETQESLRIIAPSRKRKSGNSNTTAQSYLELSKQSTKKAKQSRVAKRKRTLFNQNENEENEEPAETATSSNDAGKDNQSAAYDETDASAGEEEVAEPVKQTRKRKQPTANASKTKKPSKSAKKKRRSLSVSPTSNDRESSSEHSDEGIESEGETSYDDVLYDPAERGCQREGLRVRRIAKPWWLNSASSQGAYGYQSSQFTLQEFRNESKLKAILKKDGIKEHQFLTQYEQKLPALDKLKLFNERRETFLAGKKKHGSSARSVVKPQPSTSKSKHRRLSQDTSFSSLIQSAFRANPGIAAKFQPIENENFDICNAANVEFHDCGLGLYFGAFVDGKSDGIIKIIPGGQKPRATSRGSSLKYFVLQGTVDVTIDGVTTTLPTLSYLNINVGQPYEIKNNSDSEAILQFCRFKAT